MELKNLLFLVVLASSLLINQASAVICYECSNCAEPFPASESSLNVSCTSGLDSCLKTTIRYPGGAYITKACASTTVCKETNINIAGYGFWVNCCTTDYCNMDTKLLPQKFITLMSVLISAFIQFL